MKRIVISLVTIIVLTLMMLPVTSQPASAKKDPSCSINITSDPSVGATVFIRVTSPGSPYMLVNGDDVDSYNHAVPCGVCYEVWVTKPNVQYTVKNLTGQAGPSQDNWCC